MPSTSGIVSPVEENFTLTGELSLGQERQSGHSQL